MTSAPLHIKRSENAALANGGVIPRAVADDMAEATTILTQAEAKAAALVASTDAVVEAEKARGYAEGRADAERDFAAQLLLEAEKLDAGLKAVEVQLIDVVGSCLRQINGDIEDLSLIEKTVKTALATVRSERRAKLYVAPDALQHAQRAVDETLEEFPAMELVDVIEDVSLTSPSLRLESDLGVVQFVLDDTLADLKALLTARK